LSNPITNPGAETAPNLRPLLHAVGMENLAGILISGAVIAVLVVFLSAKARTTELALAVSLVGSLLVSYHATLSDALLLLPAFVLVRVIASDNPRRGVSGLTLPPPLYLCVLGGIPSSLAMPAAEVVFLGLIARQLSVRAKRPDDLPNLASAH